MEKDFLQKQDLKHEKVIVWLIASGIYNLISMVSLFVFILGLLFTSNILFVLSAILFGGSLGTFVFLYRKNKKKLQPLPPPPPPQQIAEPTQQPEPEEKFNKEEAHLDDEIAAERPSLEEEKMDDEIKAERPSLLS